MKIRDAACVAAGASVKAHLRQGAHLPRRTPPSPSRSSSSHHSSSQLPDKQSPQPFAGDIFGASSDYSEEDFPGLDKEHTSEPPSDSDSEENDAGDASTQPGWEPPRRTTMEEVPDEDDKMDVDIPPPRVSTPPPLQPPPAPQQVPDTADPAAKARLASVHVTHFGGKAGAPIPDTPVTPNAYLLYEAALRGGTDKPRPGKYGPFSSEMQWKIAEWAKLDGPSASSFMRLLSIHEVCH